MPHKPDSRSPQSEMPNVSASGMMLLAEERGLRDSIRRVSAAMAAGIPASPRGFAVASPGPWSLVPSPQSAVPSGPAQFSPSTPVLAVSGGVAVIDVVGPLSKGEDLYNWFFGTLTYAQLVDQVRSAARDVRVQAVLLRIDSPGGHVSGVSDLCEAILQVRQQKPVIAAISDLGASAAYMVAASAQRIFLDSDGWAGSIGVFVVIDDTSQMYQEAGWKVRVFATAKDPIKGAGVPGTAMKDEQAAEYQCLVDELGTEMIRSIYTGRPSLKTSGLKLPDGRMYMGAGAQAKGLVDGVASWTTVLQAMQGGDLAAAHVGA